MNGEAPDQVWVAWRIGTSVGGALVTRTQLDRMLNGPDAAEVWQATHDEYCERGPHCLWGGPDNTTAHPNPYRPVECTDADVVEDTQRESVTLLGVTGELVPLEEATQALADAGYDDSVIEAVERVQAAVASGLPDVARAYEVARRRLRHLHTSLAGRRKDWANNTAQPCSSARAVAYQSALQSVGSILDEIEAIAGGAR